MATINNAPITVEVNINAPINKIWDYFTNPQHITKWYNASDDWHAPHAENDLRVNGKFKTKMSAKDGSASFNFEGIYTNVEQHKVIEYKLIDDRHIKIVFTPGGEETNVVETFDPENTHAAEVQKGGWQSILNNFKTYTENN